MSWWERLLFEKPDWMFTWGDAYGYENYWGHLLAVIVLIVYGFCIFMIFCYSLLQLSLAIQYRKHKRNKSTSLPVKTANDWPIVTIQLPIFNERYVAERIIEVVSKQDYPKEKLQIQVLDDSNDETTTLIHDKVIEVKNATGLDISHIHRVNRSGYKAGALDAAMDKVKGEFIAIFDVDFIPETDFLKKTVPLFKDEKIGLVQTRWGHINKNYSLLTELQAFGLNGHFAMEQVGRNSAGHFINFNGTGGIWRKKCIASAGGWSYDTLTEDLDLSYRAQMKGWKFKYLEEVVAPAELPITIGALKTQQHRWMKGGAQCFKKLARNIITQKKLPFKTKIHGLMHLFNSSVFIFIFLLGILSIPIVHIKNAFSDLNFYIQLGGVFFASTILLMIYYWQSFRDKKGVLLIDLGRFVVRFIQFLIVSMGLSLNNAVAVIEGYLGVQSSFVRTPKFNITKNEVATHNKYLKKKLSPLTLIEGALFIVFAFTCIKSVLQLDFSMLLLHSFLTLGYGYVFTKSIIEYLSTQKQEKLNLVPKKA